MISWFELFNDISLDYGRRSPKDNLVLHYDAQVLLLGGVVDQGGGGEVGVLVLQLPVQSWTGLHGSYTKV